MNFVILSVKTEIGKDDTRDLKEEGRGRRKEKKREEEKESGLTPKSPILPCNSPKAPICSTKFFLHISHKAFNASAAERDIA
jgi:hypothetical protein